MQNNLWVNLLRANVLQARLLAHQKTIMRERERVAKLYVGLIAPVNASRGLRFEGKTRGMTVGNRKNGEMHARRRPRTRHWGGRRPFRRALWRRVRPDVNVTERVLTDIDKQSSSFTMCTLTFFLSNLIVEQKWFSEICLFNKMQWKCFVEYKFVHNFNFNQKIIVMDNFLSYIYTLSKKIQ